jgi:hypothetical protein
MRHSLLSLAVSMLLFGAGPADARVFKCEIAGKVVYSDAPCNTGAVRSMDLPDNRLEAVRPPVRSTRETQWPAPPAAELEAKLPPGSCPSETDIRNINTRLTGTVVSPRNRFALQNELAKAEKCPRGRRAYAYDDWKRLEGVLRGDE